MRLCFETTRGYGFGIKLEQAANGKFRVTYGKQVKDKLCYSEAAMKLGSCLMHALACEGNLDNRTRAEIAADKLV